MTPTSRQSQGDRLPAGGAGKDQEQEKHPRQYAIEPSKPCVDSHALLLAEDVLLEPIWASGYDFRVPATLFRVAQTF